MFIGGIWRASTHDRTGTNCAKPDRRCGQVLWDLQMHSNVASLAKIAFKNPRKLWISYDVLIGEGGKHHHRASEPPPLVLPAAQRQVKTSLARQFCDRTRMIALKSRYRRFRSFLLTFGLVNDHTWGISIMVGHWKWGEMINDGIAGLAQGQPSSRGGIDFTWHLWLETARPHLSCGSIPKCHDFSYASSSHRGCSCKL